MKQKVFAFILACIVGLACVPPLHSMAVGEAGGAIGSVDKDEDNIVFDILCDNWGMHFDGEGVIKINNYDKEHKYALYSGDGSTYFVSDDVFNLTYSYKMFYNGDVANEAYNQPEGPAPQSYDDQLGRPYCIVDNTRLYDCFYSVFQFYSGSVLLISNSSIPYFRDVEELKKYFETGDMSGAEFIPEPPAPEYTFDSELGFNDGSFHLRQLYNQSSWGCQNLLVEWAPKSSTYDKIMHEYRDDWYLELTFNINTQVEWQKKVLGSSGHSAKEDFTVICRFPISNLRNDSKSINIYKLLSNTFDSSDNIEILSTSVSEDSYLYNILEGYSSYSCSHSTGNFMDILTGSRSTGNDVVDLVGSITGEVSQAIMEFGSWLGIGSGSDVEFYWKAFDISCTGRFTNGSVKSSGTGTAYLNLLNGSNYGYTSDVDDSGNYSDKKGYHSDNNNYKVDNSTGDTYYYDYGDHSVTNITTPERDLSGQVLLQHVFTNALSLHIDNAEELVPTNNVYVYNSVPGANSGNNSSGDGVNVTIEDDDYTRDSLNEYMKYGFQLFDNVDTGDKGDGLLAMSKDLIAGLPDGLFNCLCFSVSGVCTLNLLLTLFRR